MVVHMQTDNTSKQQYQIKHHSTIHDYGIALLVTIFAWLILPLPILQLIFDIFPVITLPAILVLQYVIVLIPLLLAGFYETQLNPVSIVPVSDDDTSKRSSQSTDVEIKRQRSLLGWLGLRDQHSSPTILFGLLAGIALLAVPILVFSLIETFASWLIPTDPSTIPSVLSPQSIPDLIILLVIVFGANSLVEEIFFRGYLLRILKRRMPSFLAIIISSIIFGLLHTTTSIVTAINAFALAIVLSVIYERKQSLYAPWMAHALYNTILATLSFILLV